VGKDTTWTNVCSCQVFHRYVRKCLSKTLIAHSRGGATRLFETIVPGYEGLETRQTRKMILIKIDLSLDRRFENYELPVRTFSGKQTTVPADLVHVGLDLLMHGVGRNALIFTARLTRG